MRKIRNIILMFIAIVTIGLLVSCSSSKASITITNVSPMRTRIGVSLIVSDEDEIITSGSISLRIYDEDDNLLSTKTADETLETEQTLYFEDLDEETKYKVQIKATVDGKSKTYYNEYVSTTDEGSSASNPVLISSVSDFNSIQYDDDAYYKLEADLEFGTDEEYGSITSLFYTSSDSFNGHFDGNGHTISNISISNSYSYVGIFGNIGNGGSVENLTIKNVSISSTKGSELYLGVVAGCNQGTINNVVVDNVKITHEGTGTSKQYVGGFVGVNTNTITNSSVTNVTMDLRSRLMSTVGGFVGCNGGITQTAIAAAKIDNCSATGISITTKFITTRTVTLDDTDVHYFQYTGGFVGETNVDITNSYSEATITSTASFTAGSVVDIYDISLGGFAGRTVNGCKLTNVASVSTLSLETADAYEVNAGALVGAAYDTIITNAQGILKGENGIKDTADYSESESEDIKEMYYKNFGLIGNIKSSLSNEVSRQTNVGYVLQTGSSIKASTEEDKGYLEIKDSTLLIDTTNLSDLLKEFITKYNI